MSVSAAVYIDNRVHTRSTAATQRVFEAARDIVQETLNRANCSGHYKLIPRDQTTWKPRHGEKINLRPSQGASIKLRVKPSDNNSCWEYDLVSNGISVDIEFVRKNLESYLGKETTNGSHEQVVPPAIRPAADIVTADEPARLESPEDMLNRLVRLTDAVHRQQKRVRLLAELNEQIALVDKEIAEAQDRRAELELQVEEINKQSANDKDVAIANQISKLLS